MTFIGRCSAPALLNRTGDQTTAHWLGLAAGASCLSCTHPRLDGDGRPLGVHLGTTHPSGGGEGGGEGGGGDTFSMPLVGVCLLLLFTVQVTG